MTGAGLEARQVVLLVDTKWTVCYAIHAIPSRLTQHKASITLWPRAKTRFVSRDQPGWNADLVKSNWYRACRDQLRRRGYQGDWLWSPWGRMGDFWKSLKDLNSIAREARVLDRLRKEPMFWAMGRRARPAPRGKERRGARRNGRRGRH